MEYVLTAKQAQALDQITINNDANVSLKLMENAGKGIFVLLKNKIRKEDKILILCGSGGNGGDGYVLARYLFENNFNVSVYICSEAKKQETIVNFKAYKGKIVNDLDENYDVYVDAIFGIGLNKNLSDVYIDLINKINKKNGLKVSIDVPSGLDATTGKVYGECFKTDILYTIETYKCGFFLGKGANYINEIEIVRIGLNLEKIVEFCKVFDEEDYINFIPKREKISNKATYGKCAVIGGSPSFCGAPLLSLSALSTLRVGAGYSTLAIPYKLYPIYALKNLENTYVLLASDEKGNLVFDEENLKSLLNYDAISIGMGLGVSKEVYKTIEYLLKNYKGKLIIDADGLNSLAKYGVSILKEHVGEVIITPHVLEFARLIGEKNKENVIYNSLELAQNFSKIYEICTVLKNNNTIITYKGETIFNINGTPSLAKGGSGDVLSGIILGLIPKTKNLIKSVAFGNYILGAASKEATKTINENSVISTDVVSKISNVLNSLRR